MDLNCKDEKTLLAMCNAAFDSSSETYSELKIIEKVGSPITDLLTEMITSSSDSPFADFIKIIKATQWVRKGHEEYHGKTDGKCPYCQQVLPTNFEEEITKCFDEEYQNKINEIKNFKSAYNKMANDVISMLNKNLKSEFPNSEEELKKYTEKSDLLKTKLQLNIGSIDTKISNPASIVELEAIDGLISEVNNLAVSINNQIRAHNEIINNKKNNQPLCKEETVKFIANMLKDEIELYKSTSLKLNDELEHIR